MDARTLDPPSDPIQPITRQDIARIAAEFKQSLTTLKDLPVPIDNDTSGAPIFTEDDIKASQNEPDVLLRTLFVKYGITRLMFTRQFNRYAVSLLHIPELKVNAQRENYLRAVKNGNITWPMFIKILMSVLGMKIGRMTLELMKFTGGKVTIDVQTDAYQIAESPEKLAGLSPCANGDDSDSDKKK